MKLDKLEFLKWVATGLVMVASFWISCNVGTSKYAFLVSLTATCFWLAASIMMRERSLIVLNVYFLFMNAHAIYQWIIIG